jgi:hypothetical protein
MRNTRDETRRRWRTDDDREYGHRRRFQDFDDKDYWAERGQDYGRQDYDRQGLAYGGGQGYSYDQSFGQGEGYGRRSSWQDPETEVGSERYGATTPYGGASWGRGYPGTMRGAGARGWQGRERWHEGDEGRWGRGEWGDDERRGRFAGRGPKGYRRSDERIREDVSDRLTDDSWLDASQIDVAVEGGMVTLSGKVGDRDDKRRAEDVAMSVSGVRDVINQIHVEQGLLDQIEEAVTGGGREKR